MAPFFLDVQTIQTHQACLTPPHPAQKKRTASSPTAHRERAVSFCQREAYEPQSVNDVMVHQAKDLVDQNNMQAPPQKSGEWKCLFVAGGRVWDFLFCGLGGVGQNGNLLLSVGIVKRESVGKLFFFSGS